MITLAFIKKCASTLTPFDVARNKEQALFSCNQAVWWTYECIENYQILTRSSDKIFWWRLTIKTLRYANTFHRKKDWQK